MADDLSVNRFSSPLAEGLLRRATAPAGVVDVRGTQERYERATSWPRQHASMLDRWVGRSGHESEEQSADHVFATRLLAAAASSGEPQLPARPSVAARVSSHSDSPSRSVVGTTRPDVQRQDAVSRPEVHTGRPMRAVPAAPARTGTIARSVSPAPDLPVATGTPPRTNRAVGTPPPAPRSDAMSDSTPAARSEAASLMANDDARAPVATGASTPIGSPRNDAATNSMTSTSIRPERSSFDKLGMSVEGARAPVSTTSVVTRPELRRMPQRAATQIGGDVHATTAMRVEAPISAASPSSSSLTLSLSKGERLAHDRLVEPRASDVPDDTSTFHADASVRPFRARHAHDRTMTHTGNASTPASAPAVAQTQASAQPLLRARAATTPVVQRVAAAADSPKSEIVWRKGAEPGVGGSIAGPSSALTARPSAMSRSRDAGFLSAPPSTIARAHDSSSDGGSSPSTAAASAEPIGISRRGGPDTSQLMEQVTRRFLRQIAVERERRGGGRWP